MATTYSFNPGQRYRDVQIYALATSFPVVVGSILLGLLATALWLLWIAGPNASAKVLGLALLGTSVASLPPTFFVWALTYYPYRKSIPLSQLVPDEAGEVNVAISASYDLLSHLVPDILADKEHVLDRLVGAVVDDGAVKVLLSRLQLDVHQVATAVTTHLIPRLTFGEILTDTYNLCRHLQQEEITATYICGALLLRPELQAWLRQANFRETDIMFMLWWEGERQARQVEARRWWDESHMLDFQGLGLSWAAGFTPFVDRFSRIPAGNVWDTPLFHQQQVDQLITTLARERDSNVLLVGQPGVGRLGIIKGLAARVHGNSAHPTLNNQRVVYLHVGELLGLGGSPSEQYRVITRALSEMERAGNVILVLDGLGSILGESGEGRLNLTDALVPFFSSVAVRVVVIMSNEEYHLRVKANEELIHFFEVIQAPELTGQQTLQLLALLTPVIEGKGGIYLPYRTLRELVETTESILPEIPFPEKAFDVLEEALVTAESNKEKMLTEEAITTLISHKVGVNVGQIKQDERQHLLQLDDLIHRRVVNQVTAVTAVSRAMIRARAGVRTLSRPIGTFLFLGPTGVGKTETAKALAEVYYGSEESMQRLDMSEFTDEGAIARLIGDIGHPAGRLTTMVSDHPFTLLLLDEFEKASLAVQQLFLQVLDEGYVNDARGHKYSFKHAIIIATSNAGSEFIRQALEANQELPPDFATQLRNHILEAGVFRPELLNRFDGVITFTPLSLEHLRQVATLLLRALNGRLDAQHGVTVAVTSELLDFLVKIGYDPQFGARPMARAIQNTVEYAVAERIVRGNITPGEEIILVPETLVAVEL